MSLPIVYYLTKPKYPNVKTLLYEIITHYPLKKYNLSSINQETGDD